VLPWLFFVAAVVTATRVAATSGGSALQSYADLSARHKTAWGAKQLALAIGALIAGLTLRLIGIGNSLGGDEYGTLWAVEDTVATVLSRSISFQGQTPFYYLLLWPFVAIFGESETILRLPSVAFTLGAAGVLYAAGNLLGGRWAGLSCGVMFWLSFLGVMLGGDARPYALSLLFTSLAFYGFVRAVEDGRPLGRCLFILGGVGLVASHYLVAIVLAGLGIGYLALAPLRKHYPLPKFLMDVSIQVLLSLPFLSQVLSLWSRRRDLPWTSEISFATVLFSVAPEILLLCAALAATRSPRRGSREVVWLTFGAIAALTPLVLLRILAGFGPNLFVYRYVAGAIVPTCLIAGLAVSRLPLRLSAFGWLGWAALHAAFLASAFSQAGSFTSAGYQDWRGGVALLESRLAANPGAALLYRSGFVEDDLQVRQSPVSSAVYAPLRSPGRPPPDFPLTLLSYNWEIEGRQEYFERAVVPVIQNSSTFYYLSCDCAADNRRTSYEQRLEEWVGLRFPGRFSAERLKTGVGVVLMQYSSKEEP